ncbi:MAG: DUF4397 domain-containing protein [Gemmatimonadota bacterium]
MRAFKVLTGLAMAASVIACEDDPGVTLAPTPPLAFVRYVHVVADTSPTDWRPIDALENSPPAFALAFRANTPYRGMGSGARRLRVWPTSENINITSQHIIDTTITFTPNTYYTLIHIGYARPGGAPADRIWVLEDAIPATISSTQIAVRVVNAGIGLGAVDVGTAASTTGASTSLFSNVAYAAASAYQLVPTGARALQAFAAGTTTPALANVLVPPGIAADPTQGLGAAGGSGQGGSAVTAIIVPRAVAGSGAGTSTTPSIIYLIDRHPPRT